MNEVLWAKPPEKLLASRAQLHIWQIELELAPSLYTALIALLSPQEIAAGKSFVFEEGQRRHLISHAMKRLVLAKYLNFSPQLLNFARNEYGKPLISPGQNSLDLQFNLSHSQNLILIAVTLHDPVGIDVEWHSKSLSAEKLVKYVCSKAEYSFFSNASAEEKKAIFYRCWTRKEAYLKATGLGLVDHLKSISIDLNEFPGEDWLRVSDDLKMQTQWKLFSLNVGDFHSAAVVATAHQKHLVCYDAKALI